MGFRAQFVRGIFGIAVPSVICVLQGCGNSSPLEPGPAPGNKSENTSTAFSVACTDNGKSCSDTLCCNDPRDSCFEKNAAWASCKQACTPGIDPNDPKQFQAPWTCAVKGQRRSQRCGSRPTEKVSPTPVKKHGRLSALGNRIVDESGTAIRLRGVSLFWSSDLYGSRYYNKDVFRWLRDDWGVQVVRTAMGVESDNHQHFVSPDTRVIEEAVEAAIELEIYIIINWHAYNRWADQAQQFFSNMAKRYGSFPNVLFETWNEPQHGYKWVGNPGLAIKTYHEQVVPKIREHSDNLIILGSEFWSLRPDSVVNDFLAGSNLAYTMHFYAGNDDPDHNDRGRRAVETVLSKGKPVFVTEWGLGHTHAFAGILTELDFKSTQVWQDFMAKHSISDMVFHLSDKNEALAALQPHACERGGWGISDLTEGGRWMRDSLRAHAGAIFATPTHSPKPNGGGATPSPTPAPLGSSCSSDQDDCRASRCCATPGKQCYEKNEYWASCRDSCTPGTNPRDPVEHRTPWSCVRLSRRLREAPRIP